ncbi:MAG: hypothetical protein MJB14_13685, partial [Spirochaetes bacterium]|nr:hypothetical protein [Spirochaetota bacterium]
MKKIIIILFLIITHQFLYGIHSYDTLDYQSISVDPVTWNPLPGIYGESIFLSLKSEYGKIYYLMDDDLAISEPIEYRSPLYLKGDPNYIKEYTIIVMLERLDKKVELFAKSYKIDMTQKLSSSQVETSEKKLKSELVTEANQTPKLVYKFHQKKYTLQQTEREIILPPVLKQQKAISQEIPIDLKDNQITDVMIAASYQKDEKLMTQYDFYQFDDQKPNPPSFGSLYWGQTYKQNYKITIKPDKPTDKIYYWLREWQEDQLMFGPPKQNAPGYWQTYDHPIELISQYGVKGTFGIAAFSIGNNNQISDIAGPFYFKVTDVNGSFEQSFEEEPQKVTKRYILVNNRPIQEKPVFYQQAEMVFQGFNEEEMFYFSYEDKFQEGKSNLIPCQGSFTFQNKSSNFYEINIYYSTGEKLGSFQLNPTITLPQIKNYKSNFLESSTDIIYDFYMPKH